MTLPVDSDPPRKPARNVFSFRVRTLLLLVLISASLLGGWEYWKRRTVVDELLRTITQVKGVSADWDGSPRDRHYRLRDFSRRIAPAITGVKSVHAERMAVSYLIAAIDRALLNRDQPSMQAALAVLLFLGPEARAARETAVKVARTGATLMDARRQAVLFLGQIAEEDEAARRDLIDLLSLPDPLFQRWSGELVVHELGALGEKARDAAPDLIAMLKTRWPSDPISARRDTVVYALRKIGPPARDAVPTLIARLTDRSEDLVIRRDAVQALAAIAIFTGPPEASPAAVPPSILAALRSVLDDAAPKAVRDAARFVLDAVDQRERMWAEYRKTLPPSDIGRPPFPKRNPDDSPRPRRT